MRKGFSLVELLVSIFIGLIALLIVSMNLNKVYKFYSSQVKELSAKVAIHRFFLLLTADLFKAGYNVKDEEACVFDSGSSCLILKYVDYTKPGCLDKSFGDTNCSYVVKYCLKNKNIQRAVDKGADGDFKLSSIFDGKILQVKKFDADVDKRNKYLFIDINYEIPSLDKEYKYKFVGFCPNLD